VEAAGEPGGVVVELRDGVTDSEVADPQDRVPEGETSVLAQSGTGIPGSGYAALWAQFGPLLMNRDDGGDRINLIDRMLMGLLLNLSSEVSRFDSLSMKVVRSVELSRWVLGQLQWYVISPQQAISALAHVWSVEASLPGILERVYSSLYRADLGDENEPVSAGLPAEFWTWQFVQLDPGARNLRLQEAQPSVGHGEQGEER
jgi:hypothetical protein